MFPKASQRRLCKLLNINRSSLWRHNKPKAPKQKVIDLQKERAKKQLTEQIHGLVKKNPTWGYRRIWAWLKYRDDLCISRKTVQKIMQQNNWQVKQTIKTPRPRVARSKSETKQPNQRWAIDATSCWSKEGWVGIMAVIDCCTRQIVGIHVSERGRAQEAEAALEMGSLAQFGLVYPTKEDSRPILRSDNGKVFTSKRFVARCKQYGLEQEFITPYTPQQNGMIERFFRSLKEECIWLHTFENATHVKQVVEKWIEFYNTKRPHQSLNYQSPCEFHDSFFTTLVA